MNSQKRIAHVDMDAFFASVELLRHPELKGHPVVVGGRAAQVTHSTSQDGVPPTFNAEGYARLKDYKGRGVVTTSTYEARALGVFSGMGLMASAKLAPEAILLPAHFEAYRDMSRRFKQAVQTISRQMEDRGIDEIYLDITELPEDSRVIAQRIQDAVRDATGLTCSVGISPNKLLSKIASDMQKPKGITVLTTNDVAHRIWPLAVSKINGIGPKATAKLGSLGIQTIGELASAPTSLLVSTFGQHLGAWMHQVAHGIDHHPVTTSREPKSLSRERTFERDLHVSTDREVLSTHLRQLCERLSEDLQRKQLVCRTVGIKLKYADFQSVTRDFTLPSSISDASELLKGARECLKRVSLTNKIRLLGVRASGFNLPVNSSADTSLQQQNLPLDL